MWLFWFMCGWGAATLTFTAFACAFPRFFAPPERAPEGRTE